MEAQGKEANLQNASVCVGRRLLRLCLCLHYCLYAFSMQLVPGLWPCPLTTSAVLIGAAVTSTDNSDAMVGRLLVASFLDSHRTPEAAGLL